MNNHAIHNDDLLHVRELSKSNLLAFNTLFIECRLHQYLTGLVDQLPDRRKEILRTK